MNLTRWIVLPAILLALATGSSDGADAPATDISALSFGDVVTGLPVSQESLYGKVTLVVMMEFRALD